MKRVKQEWLAPQVKGDRTVTTGSPAGKDPVGDESLGRQLRAPQESTRMTQADDDKLGGLVIDEEIALPSSPSGFENSLHLLARWRAEVVLGDRGDPHA